MFRSFAFATIAVLTAVLPVTAAESLSARVHKAAIAACAPESSPSLPAAHYRAIAEHCVIRISDAAMSSAQAKALEKTQAATASN